MDKRLSIITVIGLSLAVFTVAMLLKVPTGGEGSGDARTNETPSPSRAELARLMEESGGKGVGAFAKGTVVDDIVVAEKNGRRVTVKVVNADEDPRMLFSYDEHTAVDPGNFWGGMRPSVALSPDRTMIAYTADDALYVRGLTDANATLLIDREDDAMHWTDREGRTFNGYGLATPTWSSDGTMIGFRIALDEGGYVGSVTYPEGAYLPLSLPGGTSDLVWSPTSNTILQAAGFGYASRAGLYLWNDGMITELDSRIGGEGTTFSSAAWSHDGTRIAAVSSGPFEEEIGYSTYLSLIDTATGDASAVDSGRISAPVFLEDGTALLYVNDGVVKRFDGTTEEYTIVGAFASTDTAWRSVGTEKDGSMLFEVIDGDEMKVTLLRVDPSGTRIEIVPIDISGDVSAVVGPHF